jgi:hypothetical protein
VDQSYGGGMGKTDYGRKPDLNKKKKRTEKEYRSIFKNL